MTQAIAPAMTDERRKSPAGSDLTREREARCATAPDRRAWRRRPPARAEREPRAPLPPRGARPAGGGACSSLATARPAAAMTSAPSIAERMSLRPHEHRQRGLEHGLSRSAGDPARPATTLLRARPRDRQAVPRQRGPWRRCDALRTRLHPAPAVPASVARSGLDGRRRPHREPTRRQAQALPARRGRPASRPPARRRRPPQRRARPRPSVERAPPGRRRCHRARPGPAGATPRAPWARQRGRERATGTTSEATARSPAPTGAQAISCPDQLAARGGCAERKPGGNTRERSADERGARDLGSASAGPSSAATTTEAR